jgi:hypothetical protein
MPASRIHPTIYTSQHHTTTAATTTTTEVCTSKSDTLVMTLGPERQVYVFAYQETCQISHSSRNTFLPGVSALSLLLVHTSVLP